MREITFITSIFFFVFGQTICLAEVNKPDANSVYTRWHHHRSERVVINWHDGIQQMSISPRIIEDANSIWIFPIKCSNEKIKFNLSDNFPQFGGLDSAVIASKALTKINNVFIATQLWTIPYWYFSTQDPYYSVITNMYQNVDSNGVHIQLLKADSIPALAQQLGGLGRLLPESELEVYADYLNDTYSLLAVWMEAIEPNTTQQRSRHYRRRPSIYVEFPSQKPFYPLINRDSAYRRLSLTITGFWQIDGQEQSDIFQCNQRICQNSDIPNLFGGAMPQENIPYSTISLSRWNSDSLPNEIHFVPGRLSGKRFADVISKLSYPGLIPLGLITLAGISYVSAGFSGLLTYRKWRGFAEFGFLNVLSILAMSIAMNYQKSSVGELFRNDKWKARKFLIFFSLLLVALSFLLLAVLKTSLNLHTV